MAAYRRVCDSRHLQGPDLIPVFGSLSVQDLYIADLEHCLSSVCLSVTRSWSTWQPVWRRKTSTSPIWSTAFESCSASSHDSARPPALQTSPPHDCCPTTCVTCSCRSHRHSSTQPRRLHGQVQLNTQRLARDLRTQASFYIYDTAGKRSRF